MEHIPIEEAGNVERGEWEDKEIIEGRRFLGEDFEMRDSFINRILASKDSRSGKYIVKAHTYSANRKHKREIIAFGQKIGETRVQTIYSDRKKRRTTADTRIPPRAGTSKH